MHNRNASHRFASRLMLGSAMLGLTLAAGGAAAQDAAETVVVTGTSIRGAAPTGSNIITVDRDAIEATGAQTVQQLLTTIPQTTFFGSAGQGGTTRGSFGTADGSGSYAPTIHSLGASASNQTLVLIDGHRIPLSGLTHNLVDPTTVAASAVQRVEVLPDGASAIYGSDAVAGVLNFITRKDYNGWETTGQYAMGDKYNTAGFSQLFGHSWDGGSVLAAYNYSSRSSLMFRDRSYLSADLRPRGGANLGSFNCPTAATLARTSAASQAVYLYPYGAQYTVNDGGTTVPVTAGQTQYAPCDNTSVQGLLPADLRHNMLVAVRQAINDRISVNADLVYSWRATSSRNSRGNLSATAFRNGAGPLGAAQNNPFFVPVPGTTGAASNSEFVRYTFDDLFGPGATTKGGGLTAFAAVGVDVDLGGDWLMSVSTTAGVDNSFSRSSGSICSACANLALNGTSNTSGTANTTPANSAIADSYGLGTVVSVTRSLNTTNALDVWMPAATNRTSQTVRDSLLDNNSSSQSNQTMNDVTVKFDGPLFDLPAGTVRAAFGGEYTDYNYQLWATSNNSTGPSSSSSRLRRQFGARNTYAAFTEVQIPVISADAGIPLMQKFDFSMAGRYDQYSDFGGTKNPKLGFTWVVTDGLSLRGSYGTSFTAPALTSLPDGFNKAANNNTNPGNIAIDPSHVNAPGSWCATGCTLDAAHPGITLTGAAQNKAMTGLSYSLGVDLRPGDWWDVLEGLTVNVTYWQTKAQGLITTPLISNEANVRGLQPLLTLAPPGGWASTDPALQSQIAGYPLSAPLNPTIWFVYRNLQINAFNIFANGIDFDVRYTFNTENYGNFTFGINGSEKLRFDENQGPGSVMENFLNGININTTFSAIQFQGRLMANWALAPFTVNLGVNFTNPYWLRTGNVPNNVAQPVGCTTNCVSPAGFQHVGSNTTMDVNVAMDVPSDLFGGLDKGYLTSGMQVYVNATNLLDTKPPFWNSGTGYDPDNSSPIGRVVSLGFRKKW